MFKRIWFYYKVKSGDTSPDLSYVNSSSLTDDCAEVKQYLGELDATLTLPSPGASGSLSDNKALVINPSTGQPVKKIRFGIRGGIQMGIR